MAIEVPDVALTVQLDALLDAFDLWFHLFTNDLVPSTATTLTDFEEPDWTDYQPIRVTTFSPSLIRGHRSVSWADPAVWTRGTGGTRNQVYGYYVTEGRNGPLLWCERRLLGPVTLDSPNAKVTVQPEYQIASAMS